MSVRVRLTRVGSKKNPIWRVVVADQRSPRDGRFIESVGQYNPQTDPSTIVLDEDRLQHWIARGAEPTGTVKQLMRAYAKGPRVAPDEAATGAPAAAEPATATAGTPESAEAPAADEPEAAASAPEADSPGDASPAGDADAAAPEAAASEPEAVGSENAETSESPEDSSAAES